MIFFIRIGLLIVFTCIISACGGDASPKPPEAIAEIPIVQEVSDGDYTARIFWQVPIESVLRYHFKYGEKVDSLVNSVTVSIHDLTKNDHPYFGPVFTYILNINYPAEKVVVSLQAENKLGKSDWSFPIVIDVNQSN